MSKNLDTLINKISFEIVNKIQTTKNESERKKYKNEIDKALGVLSNDGVYAYYVYVKSKKIDDIFLNELKQITEFISESERKLNQYFFKNLSQNLNQLLFFREILEKILIYARYHAKAMGD